MKDLTYKCHTLAINELPNFKNPQDKLYRGTTIIDGKKWEKDGSAVYLIENWFRDKIDNLYLGMTYDEICCLWVGRWKSITYKNRKMLITARKRTKDNKVIYLGEFCSKDNKRSRSIESIHYDKVISKFERFVDEYCTEWQARASYLYKGYDLRINQERDKEFYLGTVQFHKNSIYKHLADTREEVERCCRNRIGKVVYEKEKVNKTSMINTKEEKIKYLETQIDQLSSELEKVKNEKATMTYRGVTLEYGKEEGLPEGYLIGRFRNAPKGTKEFKRKVVANMQTDFEEYIDELEKATNIYLELTGQEFYIPEKHDY